MMAIMDKAAGTFGYRDRLAFAARCIQAVTDAEQKRDQT